MSGLSLERERQAILQRMQVRRDTYRRMLDGDLYSEEEIAEEHAHADGASSAAWAPEPQLQARNAVTRVVMKHPLLCALGVAAILAIGPRRIARTVMKGVPATALLPVAKQPALDLVGRLLNAAGAYLQGRGLGGR